MDNESRILHFRIPVFFRDCPVLFGVSIESQKVPGNQSISSMFDAVGVVRAGIDPEDAEAILSYFTRPDGPLALRSAANAQLPQLWKTAVASHPR